MRFHSAVMPALQAFTSRGEVAFGYFRVLLTAAPASLLLHCSSEPWRASSKISSYKADLIRKETEYFLCSWFVEKMQSLNGGTKEDRGGCLWESRA